MIVETLRLAGFGVLHTTAYRQKGPSGVAKGVPDLLVYHELVPHTFLGLEVKRPGPVKFTSPEQRQLAEAHVFAVAQDEVRALEIAHHWLVTALNGFTDTRITESIQSSSRATDRSRRLLVALVGENRDAG